MILWLDRAHVQWTYVYGMPQWLFSTRAWIRDGIFDSEKIDRYKDRENEYILQDPLSISLILILWLIFRLASASGRALQNHALFLSNMIYSCISLVNWTY